MIRSFGKRMPIVSDTCYVDSSAQVIGDVVLGEQVSVWMNAVVRGDVHSIRIGARSNVQDCAVLHGMRNRYAVQVGEGVSIGHNATVHGCVVEDDCLIGMGATVLNGARIGEGSIVAAGAVVPESMIVPPRSLVMGLPAKVRRAVTEEDLEMIRGYAANYLDYLEQYRREQPYIPA